MAALQNSKTTDKGEEVNFHCAHFGQLKSVELYEILALRMQVFCVEQNCVYQDLDGKDLNAYHLTLRDESGKLLGYTRLLPKGISYEAYASIGRVVSDPSARGKGLGKILMEESIRKIKALYPNDPVKIGAQTYLIKFYTALGFEAVGEGYLEDNIPHISMILKETA